ncbi:hypothetical protein EVAR_16926_1 [Eumeta japonica]|uniref:Uncharacterized protein n=1 Tax=Eumeta variegata TaxID=151549 RepID=A0A4C1TVB8_EUMVA|nr:hypothetical protein EVAR_16926_1 [Eumeta japonica]
MGRSRAAFQKQRVTNSRSQSQPRDIISSDEIGPSAAEDYLITGQKSEKAQRRALTARRVCGGGGRERTRARTENAASPAAASALIRFDECARAGVLHQKSSN